MILNKDYLSFCIREKYRTIANWAKEYGISERMAHYYLKKRMNPEILTDLIIDLELEPREIFIKKEIRK
ncbi:hypothetical protein HH195_12205 (plasmid) [Sarcina sp. JB2]|uniref:Uncharacterized protein n=1 Tax=Candidatus Sarcina troglodytae TaxID=2726954 RepID=A0ACD1BH96_9CLOT|nr:hypothetical protein [Sarcina sp. JB2]QPJ86728.1 hypothetical protein HH195_12205 [Sarcina sp. JB2]